MRDPFEVLGLPEDASSGEVAAAYRRLARSWHPDRHASAGPYRHVLAEFRMAEISDAFRQLLDPYEGVGTFDYRRAAPTEFVSA